MTAALEGGWVVSSTPRPYFTPGKDPLPIVQAAGWAPGPVWTGGKSRPTGIRFPDRPARTQSLYRLSYPAHLTWVLLLDKYDRNWLLPKWLLPKRLLLKWLLPKRLLPKWLLPKGLETQNQTYSYRNNRCAFAHFCVISSKLVNLTENKVCSTRYARLAIRCNFWTFFALRIPILWDEAPRRSVSGSRRFEFIKRLGVIFL